MLCRDSPALTVLLSDTMWLIRLSLKRTQCCWFEYYSLKLCRGAKMYSLAVECTSFYCVTEIFETQTWIKFTLWKSLFTEGGGKAQGIINTHWVLVANTLQLSLHQFSPRELWAIGELVVHKALILWASRKQKSRVVVFLVSKKRISIVYTRLLLSLLPHTELSVIDIC